MRVWITRSEPGASRTAQHLAGAGHECVVAPVVAIAAVPVADTALGDAAQPVSDVIFLSEHAVAPGIALLQKAGLELLDLTTFAVGPQTAARLAEFGLRPIVPGLATSEGLLELPELAAVVGRTLVILSGEAGRQQLRQGLERRGGSVLQLALYRRVQIPVHDVRPAIRPKAIDAIAVSSGDGFRWAAQVWSAAQGRPQVPVLTPSQRVSNLAPELGFSRAYTCQGAGADALLAGLARVAG